MIHQKDLRLGDLVQITVDLPEYKRGDIFVVIRHLRSLHWSPQPQ